MLSLISGLWVYNVKAQCKFYEDDCYYNAHRDLPQDAAKIDSSVTNTNFNRSLWVQSPDYNYYSNLNLNLNFNFNYSLRWPIYKYWTPQYINTMNQVTVIEKYNGLYHTGTPQTFVGPRSNFAAPANQESEETQPNSTVHSVTTKAHSANFLSNLTSAKRNGFGTSPAGHSVAS